MSMTSTFTAVTYATLVPLCAARMGGFSPAPNGYSSINR
jgi:hypothetical protein